MLTTAAYQWMNRCMVFMDVQLRPVWVHLTQIHVWKETVGNSIRPIVRPRRRRACAMSTLTSGTDLFQNPPPLNMRRIYNRLPDDRFYPKGNWITVEMMKTDNWLKLIGIIRIFILVPTHYILRVLLQTSLAKKRFGKQRNLEYFASQ